MKKYILVVLFFIFVYLSPPLFNQEVSAKEEFEMLKNKSTVVNNTSFSKNSSTFVPPKKVTFNVPHHYNDTNLFFNSINYDLWLDLNNYSKTHVKGTLNVKDNVFQLQGFYLKEMDILILVAYQVGFPVENLVYMNQKISNNLAEFNLIKNLTLDLIERRLNLLSKLLEADAFAKSKLKFSEFLVLKILRILLASFSPITSYTLKNKNKDCVLNLTIKLQTLPDFKTKQDLDSYENELENPTTLTFTSPSIESYLNLTSSEKCFNILKNNVSNLENEYLVGLSILEYYKKGRIFNFSMYFVTFFEIMITLNLMEKSYTQSSLVKISPITFSFMTLLDSYYCVVSLMTGLLLEDLFLPFSSTSLLKFVLFSVLEVRYLCAILKAHQRGGDTSSTGRSAISTYYVYPFLGIFFIHQILSGVFPYVLYLIMFILYSFWVPQILRNMTRNTRKSVDFQYVISITFLRSLPVLYYLNCPNNLLNYSPQNTTSRNHQLQRPHEHFILDNPFITSALFVSYLSFQVLVLYLQKIQGSRFFISDKFGLFLPGHDYYQAITNKNFRFVKGDDDAEVKEDEEISLNFECNICFMPVNITSNSMLGTEKDYMITPCHHLYHAGCLEKWMEVKLECPVCRQELPDI
ncbi:hypothetical protein HDU92_004599 [Lobulomyces angularis]|nr:hypothetical protein HDU92_004599 [Lobulomyces angularis]